MLRFGRKTQKLLTGRAKRRLLRLRETYIDETLTSRQRKGVRQIQRKLLSNAATLAAIKTSKSRKVLDKMGAKND